MLPDSKKIGAIIDCRVSSPKQAREGESLEVQLDVCRKFVTGNGWHIEKEWALNYSGRTDSSVFQEQLAFLDQHPGLVQRYVFRAIDRFTRKGSLGYETMREELLSRGVDMVDAGGIIQPTKNTLEDVGFEYAWSRTRPSEITEVVLATTAKQEITTILTRMTGQSIRLTQRGYKVRGAQDGYKNEKTYVDGKKRFIQIPDPDRAKYLIAMYELRAAGQLTDQEIVDRINAMGYRTRLAKHWDKKHQKILGTRGGIPLNVKHLQEVIQRPIYCGVVCEKWTRGKPIKAQYKGLVSIETFNIANRGKIFIRETGTELEILYDYHPEKIVHRRTRNNSLFPYKNVVLCPECHKPFLGSSSRSQNGKLFPAYHCSRNHERVSAPQTTLNTEVETYLARLQFQPEVLASLKEVILDRRRNRQKEVLNTASEVGHNVADLEAQKAQAIGAFKTSTSDVMRRELEKDVERLTIQIEQAQTQRNKLEVSETDIERFIKEAQHLMEHPSELLLNPANIQQQQALWSLVFSELPSYDQILNANEGKANGTPNLTFVFKVALDSMNAQSDLVPSSGIEPKSSP